jgi:hypothetical protein
MHNMDTTRERKARETLTARAEIQAYVCEKKFMPHGAYIRTH